MVTGYTYDANGSLTQVQVGGAVVTQDQYDPQNRLSKSVTYSTNAQGVIVTTTTLAYDPGGDRTRETTTVQQAGMPDKTVVQLFLVSEYNPTGDTQVLDLLDGSGTLQMTYVIGSSILSQVAANGQETYFLADAIGSTRLLVSPGGTIAARFNYTAYGEARGFDPARAGTSILFAGEQYDAALGQYYMRARYYDAQAGTFTQIDPLLGDPGAPLTLNKYAYAAADPVNNIDPSGQGWYAARLGVAVHTVISGVFLAYDPGGQADVRLNALEGLVEGLFDADFDALLDFISPDLQEAIDNLVDAQLTRPDLVSSLRGIFEIKPNNANQIARGNTQLDNYVSNANTAGTLNPSMGGPVLQYHRGEMYEFPIESLLNTFVGYIAVPAFGVGVTISQPGPPNLGLILYTRDQVQLRRPRPGRGPDRGD